MCTARFVRTRSRWLPNTFPVITATTAVCADSRSVAAFIRRSNDSAAVLANMRKGLADEVLHAIEVMRPGAEEDLCGSERRNGPAGVSRRVRYQQEWLNEEFPFLEHDQPWALANLVLTAHASHPRRLFLYRSRPVGVSPCTGTLCPLRGKARPLVRRCCLVG